jgi:hypothetical protein
MFAFVAVAITISVAFAVSSIFSSRVTAAGGAQFLLNSPNCGYFNYSLVSPTLEGVKLLNVTYFASAYEKSCYEVDSSSTAQYDTYVKSQIPWISNTKAPYSFAANTCNSSASTYEMDTGPMDSHSTLGLNAKPSERVTVRKLATCAVVAAAPYKRLVNLTYNTGSDVLDQVMMGPRLNPDGSNLTNYTY